MKKTSMLLMLLLAMTIQSYHVIAQSVTITLIPGYNWISNPSTDTLDFSTALGSFTPITGDIIQSQWGNAYYRNGQWYGTISQFYPGYGYMYYSKRTMPVTLTFNVQQPAPQLIVTTAEPTDITAISAVSGGSITSNDGSYIYVFMKGICWATHPNPTVMNDFHTENGGGINSFTAEMTDLVSNTIYYVRAFAVTSNGTFYGEEVSFTTDHAYVDLGLPSGTLWATCNVGATTPEEYGDYFAWGEFQPKNFYDWSTYQYCNGSEYTLTKYCNNAGCGYNGFTDNLITLLPEDDAATVNWGTNWRMPTKEEWVELYTNTTRTWATQNGVHGCFFTAMNGNSLFLPMAGASSIGGTSSVGELGFYWSTSLYVDFPLDAWHFRFDGGHNTMDYYPYRSAGLSIRPVRSSQD